MHRSPTAILDSSCSRLALPYLILNPPSAGMVGGLPIDIFTGDSLPTIRANSLTDIEQITEEGE